MKISYMLICLLVIAATPLRAQTPSDRDELLKGQERGQEQFAEALGYPDPEHILAMEQTLGLTIVQKEKIKAILDDMTVRASDVGKTIIKIEDDLRAGFREGLATEKSITSDAQDIGRLRGKLRALHLIANLKTKRVLTDKQVEMYSTMKKKEEK